MFADSDDDEKTSKVHRHRSKPNLIAVDFSRNESEIQQIEEENPNSMRNTSDTNNIDEDNDDDDDDDEDIEDDDLDEELALPKSLANSISIKDKRELLQFKRKHSEVEWEEEIHRRGEEISRKLDFERLKMMSGNATTKTTAKRKEIKGKTVTTSINKKTTDTKSKKPVRGRKAKVIEKESSEESNVEEDESDEESEDDDLFGEDELFAETNVVNKVSKKVKSLVADDEVEEDMLENSDEDEKPKVQSKAKRLTSKSIGKVTKSPRVEPTTKSTRKSAKDFMSDDDEEDDDEDDEGDEKDEDEDHEEGEVDSESDDRLFDRKAKDSSKNVSQYYDSSSAFDTSAVGEEAELVDYLKIQITRSHFERWIFEPFLEKAVEGGFVRYLVGEVTDKDGITVPVYRMCEVASIDDGKDPEKAKRSLTYRPYTLPKSNITTTIRLNLAIGGSVKTGIRIDKISNSRITSEEFKIYKETLKTSMISTKKYISNGGTFKILTKDQISNRKLSMVNTRQHVYTFEEVNEMVKRREAENKLIHNGYVKSLQKIEKIRDQAKANNQLEEVLRLDREIAKIHREMDIKQNLHDKATLKFSIVNKRNREANFRKDVEAGQKKRQELLQNDANIIAKHLQSQNPYLRRETRPTSLWNTSEKLEMHRLQLVAEQNGIKPVEQVIISSPAKQQSTMKTISISGLSGAAVTISSLLASQQMIHMDNTAFDELRRRVSQRLGGLDPARAALMTPRERYLNNVCGNLPPLGSQEREKLRKGYSFQYAQLQLRKQQEENNDMQES